MASVLVIAALLIALVVLVAVGVGIRNEAKEGGEEIIKNVYIYLVLFATLMMTIGGSVGVFMAMADIVAPTPYYQNIEDFETRMTEQTDQSYTAAEIQTRYEVAVKSHHEEQIARAKNSLIKSFGWIVIPLPVFLFFQRRLANKEAPSII